MLTRISFIFLILQSFLSIADNPTKVIFKNVDNGLRILLFEIDPPKFFAKEDEEHNFIVDLGQKLTIESQLSNKLATGYNLKDDELLITLNYPIKVRKFFGDNFIGIDLLIDGNEKIIRKTKEKNEKITETEQKIAEKPTKNDETRQMIKALNLGENIRHKVQSEEKKLDSNEIEQKQFAEEINAQQISIIQNENSTIVKFPWHNIIPAASFNRAGYLYVIFADNKNPPILPKKFPNNLGKIAFIHKDGYSIYRLKITRTNSDMVREGKEWQLIIPHDDNAEKHRSKLEQLEYSHKNISIAVPFADKYLKFIDPYVGDELLVVPLSNDLYYVAKDISTPDFEVLETIQGVVIVKNNDEFKLSLEDPLAIKFISPNAFKELDKTGTFYSGKSFFDFSQWQKNKSNFDKKTAEIYTKILKDGRSAEQTLKLAKLYAGNGMMHEAIALLELIRKDYNEFWRENNQLPLLQAAWSFLNKDYIKSAAYWQNVNFNLLSPQFYNEFKSWIAATNLMLNPAYNKHHINYDKYKSYFFAEYPPAIKKQFIMAEIEHNLKINNQQATDKLLKLLRNFGRDEADYLYLKAKYFAVNKDYVSALKIYEELSEKIMQPKIRLQSIIEAIKIKAEQKKINTKDALKELNKARIIWRGDKFELDLLNYIGDLHWQNKEYAKAFYSWREAVSNFSDSGDSIVIASKMSENYANLIIDNKNYEIDEFNLVAVFKEFNELTPIGQLGDEVNQSIIQYLLKLDLLDEAATILENQINYRTQEIKRNQFIADYAYIQIMNNKPKQSLLMIDKINKQFLTAELANNLYYLTIIALIKNKNYEDALEKLAFNRSDRAEKLRMDILWRQQNWQEIAKYYGDLSEGWWEHRVPITEEMQTFLVKLVVAQTMIGDKNAVNFTGERFLDKMDANSGAYTIIKFLSSNQLNFDSIPKIYGSIKTNIIEDFIKEYSERLNNNLL